MNRHQKPSSIAFLLLTGAALLLPCAGGLRPARAQDTAAATKDTPPEQIASEIKTIHPKVVALVFDVTESTKSGGVFGRERAAAATVIHNGCSAGDRVVLESFGTSYRTVFDHVLTSSADANALVDQIPEHVEPGHGTNIRLPHHAALQLIEKASPEPGVVILLTDSFNDRPLETDADYPAYLKYYTLASLTKYPDTPENSDYERLLRTLKASGRLTQYGVGVGIAESGRPIERLPVGPGESDSGAVPALTPTVVQAQGAEHPASTLPTILIGAGVALLALLALAFALLNRPLPVRLALGEKGTPRDYRLRKGAKVGLGGSLTTAAAGDDNFPLGGAAQPMAFVQAERGGATVIPAPDQPDGTTIFHNGARLERPSPLRYGDEVRIVLPAADGGMPREHRVKYLDPSKPLF